MLEPRTRWIVPSSSRRETRPRHWPSPVLASLEETTTGCILCVVKCSTSEKPAINRFVFFVTLSQLNFILSVRLPYGKPFWNTFPFGTWENRSHSNSQNNQSLLLFHIQIMENKEICDLVKIMGLQYKKKYQSQEDMKSLRSDMKLQSCTDLV